MNYIKYFQENNYTYNTDDCWTFIQEVFKDEHNIELPEHPILEDEKIKSFLIANIKHEVVKEAQKGCIIYFSAGNMHHAAYALDNKKMIHKTFKGVEVDDIPKKATIFKVLDD